MKTPLQHESVLVEYQDNIAIVSLNRPDKHNGIHFEMLESLLKVGKALRRNKNIRAVILKGMGPSFCAGLDFSSVMKHPFKILFHFFKRPFRPTGNFQEIAWIWRKLPMPVIAAVHGNCFGGGFQMALAADFRFVAADTKMSMMEVKWGLVPDMTGTVTLSELVRLDVAKDLAFTGRIVDVEEAAQMGLVSKVCADVFAEALAYAQVLASRSPDALAGSKLLFNKNHRSRIPLSFLRERIRQLRIGLGKNAKIAVTAGLKKETPVFKNRSF